MAVRATSRLQQVDVQALDPAQLEPLIGPERMARFEATAHAARRALAGRVALNVNSTAHGGGVAEMLQTLLAYARGAGVDARWVVIEGDPAFFAVTKRIHNGLYGVARRRRRRSAPAERAAYERTLRAQRGRAAGAGPPGRHRPAARPADGRPGRGDAGARAPRSCGAATSAPTAPNEWTERAWEFLRPYLERGRRLRLLTAPPFAPPWIDDARRHVIPPSIDPFSAKNEPMSRAQRAAIALGVRRAARTATATLPAVPFTRRDGSPGRIDRRVDVLQTGPPPPRDAPLVVQVSRWDAHEGHGRRHAGLRRARRPRARRAPRAGRARP